jgi:hypothetical protein
MERAVPDHAPIEQDLHAVLPRRPSGGLKTWNSLTALPSDAMRCSVCSSTAPWWIQRTARVARAFPSVTTDV